MTISSRIAQILVLFALALAPGLNLNAQALDIVTWGDPEDLFETDSLYTLRLIPPSNSSGNGQYFLFEMIDGSPEIASKGVTWLADAGPGVVRIENIVPGPQTRTFVGQYCQGRSCTPLSTPKAVTVAETLKNIGTAEILSNKPNAVGGVDLVWTFSTVLPDIGLTAHVTQVDQHGVMTIEEFDMSGTAVISSLPAGQYTHNLTVCLKETEQCSYPSDWTYHNQDTEDASLTGITSISHAPSSSGSDFNTDMAWYFKGKPTGITHTKIRLISSLGEMRTETVPIVFVQGGQQNTTLELDRYYGAHRLAMSACSATACGEESLYDFEVRMQDPDIPVVSGNVPGVDKISLLEVGNLHTISWGELTLGPGITHRSLYRRIHGGDHFLVEDGLDLAGGSITRADSDPIQYKYYLKSCRYQRCGKKGLNSVIEIGDIPEPTNLTATAQLTAGALSGLQLNWSQPSSSDWDYIGEAVDRYEVTMNGPDGIVIGPVTVSRADNSAQSTALPTTAYGEYHAELKGCIGSICSPLISTTTQVAPGQVQNLRLDSSAISLDGEISLSWDAVPGAGIDYRLMEEFDMNGFAMSDNQPMPGALSIELGRNPENQGAYRFMVLACSNSVCGDASAPVEVVVGSLPRPESNISITLLESSDPNDVRVQGNFPTVGAAGTAIYETIRWVQVESLNIATGRWEFVEYPFYPNGLTSGEQYTIEDSDFDYGVMHYRVRACDGDFNCGAWRAASKTIENPADSFCDIDIDGDNRSADFSDLSPGQWRIIDMPDQGLDLYWDYEHGVGHKLKGTWYTFAVAPLFPGDTTTAPIWFTLRPDADQDVEGRITGDLVFERNQYNATTGEHDIIQSDHGRYALVFNANDTDRAQLFWDVTNPPLGTFYNRAYAFPEDQSTLFPQTNAHPSTGFTKVYQLENLGSALSLDPPSGTQNLSVYNGLYEVSPGAQALTDTTVYYSQFFEQNMERATVLYFSRVDSTNVDGAPLWVRGRSTIDSAGGNPLDRTAFCVAYHRGYRADKGPSINYVNDEERQLQAGTISRFIDPILYNQTQANIESLNLRVLIGDHLPVPNTEIDGSEFWEIPMVKRFGTNNIWFQLTEAAPSTNTCELNNSCQMNIRWNTDPEMPTSPAIFKVNVDTNQEVWLSSLSSGNLERSDNSFTPGRYLFRIRTHSSPQAQILAESEILTVQGQTGPLDKPDNLRAVGQIQSAPFDYSMIWSAPTSGNFSHYVLEEQLPGQSVFNVVSDVIVGTSYDFERSAEEAGAYRYRVKACPSNGACSAYEPDLSGYEVVLGQTQLGTAEPAPQPLNVPIPDPDPISEITGQTSGSFDVAQSGAATYSIPFMTVPGTGGVAPTASLNYSSQAGPGLAGTGWSLSAMSVISRCGQTYEQDGRVRGVRMDSDDRFCMDGQRLLMVNSSNPDHYGNDGIEYRTETDSFTRVVSYGDVGGSPQYFKVQRKDGSTSYFGDWCFDGSPERSCTLGHQTKDDDSFILSHLPSGVAYAWAMDWFEDSAGNYYKLKYFHGNGEPIDDDGVVDFVLRRIDYTGHVDLNPNDNVNTALDTHAKLLFDYEALPPSEVSTGWQAGVQTRSTRRLSAVQSKNNTGSNKTLRYYALGYSPTGDGFGRSRLDSVTECRDSTQAVCYEAIEFDWSNNRNEITEHFQRNLIDSADTWPRQYVTGSPADINGDGLQDVMMFSTGGGIGSNNVRMSAVLSDPSNSQRAVRVDGPILSTHIFGSTGGPSQNAEYREQRFSIGDFNADNFQDLIYADKDTGQWLGRQWSGVTNNFLSQAFLGTIETDGDPYDVELLGLMRMADMNGDGLADLIYAYDDRLYLSLHQGQGASIPYTTSHILAMDVPIEVGIPDVIPDPAEIEFSRTRLQLLDYNGDGAIDILARVKSRICYPGSGCPPELRSAKERALINKQGYLYGISETPAQSEGNNPDYRSYHAWHVLISDGQGGIEDTVALLSKQGAECDDTVFPVCGQLQPIGEDKHLYLPDLNADGLSDLVYRLGTDGDNSWHYRINRGTNVTSSGQVTANDILGPQLDLDAMERNSIGDVRFIDYDGNGYTDILFIDDKQITDPTHPAPNAQEKWQVVYNHADGLVGDRDVTDLWGGDDGQGDQTLFLDFNGDGRLDQIFVNKNSENRVTNAWLNFARNALDIPTVTSAWSYHTPLNVITAFKTGINLGSVNVNTTRVHYGAMTRRTVYSRHTTGGSSAFGEGSVVYDMVPNGYAVQEVESTNPHVRISNGVPVSAGNTSSVRYYYAGAKMQGGGRGFLGFAELMTYDGQGDVNGILTTTRYRQDFPFTGTPYETIRWYVADESELPWNQATDGIALPPCFDNSCAPEIPPIPCDRDWGCHIDQPNRGQSNNLIRLSHEFSDWTSMPTVGNSRFIYVSQSTEKTWMPIHDGAGRFVAEGPVVTSVVTEHLSYDNYGNPTQMVQTHYDGDVDAAAPWTYRKTSNDVFANLVDRWHLGRLMNGSVLHQRPGQPSITRTTEFGYDALTGVLDLEVVEPNTEFEVRTVHNINELGLKDSTTVFYQEDYGNNQTTRSRTTRVEYDADYRFVDRKYNAENVLVESTLARNEYGAPTEVMDADGVSNHTRYDAMGKAYFQWSDVGAFSKTTQVVGQGSVCPATAAFHVVTESDYTYLGQASAVQPTSWVCHDVLGREIRKVTEHFNGNRVYVDMHYDNQNRALATSRPQFRPADMTENNEWTLAEYDALGRAWRATMPDGSETTTDFGLVDPEVGGAFNGRLLRITNPMGQVRYEQKNSFGELEWVRDHLGGVITYEYDALGNLTATGGVLDGNVDRSIMQYNRLGQKVSMDDPDKGTWYYRYNSLGELLCQMDANWNGIRQSYDALGRQTRSDQSDEINWTNCSLTDPSVSTWSYNPVGVNGYGKVNQQIQVGFDQDIGTTSTIQSETYSYDAFGRLSEIQTQIDESVNGQVSSYLYYRRTTYDEVGRVFQQFDASTDAFSSLGARHVYNEHGFLQMVREAAVGDIADLTNCYAGSTYYQCIETMDAYGNVTEEFAGNGSHTVREFDELTNRISTLVTEHNGDAVQNLRYAFDAIGNLTMRETIDTTLFEEFHYDELNRLIAVDTLDDGVISGGAALTASMTYDAAGNLQSRTGDTVPGDYVYGYENGTGSCATAGPHALCRLGGSDLVYDNNGNNTDGEGRYLQYTVRNKPWQLSKGANTTEFWYDAGNKRFMRRDDHSKVTHYVGNVEVIRDNGVTTVKRYVASAIIDQDSSGIQTALKFKHVDHLGSTDAITGSLGDDVEKLSFDAFGQRREASTWGDPLGLINPIADVTTRGYTGHEHVDAIGIIHMNGRIYDARIGRFLQADPFIQAPKNSQNLNRYSYVLNNPLSYTDPSGHFFAALATMVGTAIQIRASYEIMKFAAQQPILNTVYSIVACSAGGPWGCAAWATFSAHVNGASWQQAIKAGAIAGVSAKTFGKIGDLPLKDGTRILAHAATGGVIEVLQGGKFGHGFASAGLSKAFSLNAKDFLLKRTTVEGALIMGMVGGTISEATGGKFANGAVTAAIAYRFNQVGKGRRDASCLIISYGCDSEIIDTDVAQAEIPDFGKALDQYVNDVFDFEFSFGVQVGATLKGAGVVTFEPEFNVFSFNREFTEGPDSWRLNQSIALTVGAPYIGDHTVDLITRSGDGSFNNNASRSSGGYSSKGFARDANNDLTFGIGAALFFGVELNVNLSAAAEGLKWP